MKSVFHSIVQGIGWLLMAVYPIAVYFALSRWGASQLAPVVVCLFLASAIARFARWRRKRFTTLIALPLFGAAILATTALLNPRMSMLLVPVVINSLLFVSFFGSLFFGTPMVEQFARIANRSLSAAEVQYCRHVTQVWVIFFLLNGAIAAALAVWGSLAQWTLYTGFLSYLLIGAIGFVEFSLRKYRFRRYGNSAIDRLYAAIFPPQALRE